MMWLRGLARSFCGSPVHPAQIFQEVKLDVLGWGDGSDGKELATEAEEPKFRSLVPG